MEKAFDRVGHHIIVQALRAFEVPEIMIMAIQHYTLVGFANMEVNGRAVILITIKTGSGQGDPLSTPPRNSRNRKKSLMLSFKCELR
jgi:hypothetical protein